MEISAGNGLTGGPVSDPDPVTLLSGTVDSIHVYQRGDQPEEIYMRIKLAPSPLITPDFVQAFAGCPVAFWLTGPKPAKPEQSIEPPQKEETWRDRPSLM
jgi:hypothetical protein